MSLLNSLVRFIPLSTAAATLLCAQQISAQCVPDDAFEPNDLCSSSTLLQPGRQLGLVVCDGADDWFRFNVPVGNFVEITVTYQSSMGDIDLRVWDNCGGFSYGSGSELVSGTEIFRWENNLSISNNLSLRVFMSTAGATGTYDLDVTIGPAPCYQGADDPFEPNDICWQATPIGSGAYTSLIAYKWYGSVDWYSVDVPAGQTLNVDLVNLSGDIDVNFYSDCLDTWVTGSGQTGLTGESASWTNPNAAPTTIYVRTVVKTGAVEFCGQYDMLVSGVTFVEPFCFGDGSGTACPCGNNSTIGHPGGCSHQSGDGAILTATGLPSAAVDTLRFDLDNAPSNTFALLVSGVNALPQVGGCVGCGLPSFDGLRCVGGAFLRHGVRSTGPGGSTSNSWSSVIAANGFVAGQERHFQAFFRTNPVQTCQTGQNSSNAVTITVMP